MGFVTRGGPLWTVADKHAIRTTIPAVNGGALDALR